MREGLISCLHQVIDKTFGNQIVLSFNLTREWYVLGILKNDNVLTNYAFKIQELTVIVFPRSVINGLAFGIMCCFAFSTSTSAALVEVKPGVRSTKAFR